MMHIITAILVYSCLSLYSYLNYYCLKQVIPNASGFLLMTEIQNLLILINCLYFLGWLWGIAVFVTVMLGRGIITFPLNLLLYCVGTQTRTQKFFLGERPNPQLHGTWLALILALAVLTVISFVVTDFGSGLITLAHAMHSLSRTTLVVGAAIIGLGIYLFVGLGCVASDYCAPWWHRPVYTFHDTLWEPILHLLLWPISRIGRRIAMRHCDEHRI